MGELHQVKYYFSKLPPPVLLLESAASEAQEVGCLCPLTLNVNTSVNEIIFRFVKDLCRAVPQKEKQQCSRYKYAFEDTCEGFSSSALAKTFGFIVVYRMFFCSVSIRKVKIVCLNPGLCFACCCQKP